MANLQYVNETAVKPLIRLVTSKRGVDFPEQHAAPKAYERRRQTNQTVGASKQHAENKRRKRVRHDQAAHVGSEKAIVAAVANDQDQLGHRQLQEHDREDQKHERVLRCGFRLIDPQLRNRGGQKQERDDKILGGLGLMPAENEESHPADETGEDQHLDIYIADSRFRSNSLRVRRRRVLREASPRLTSRPRLKKSSMWIFG